MVTSHLFVCLKCSFHFVYTNIVSAKINDCLRQQFNGSIDAKSGETYFKEICKYNLQSMKKYIIIEIDYFVSD